MAKKTGAPIPVISVKALVPVNYDGVMYGPGLPDGDTFDVRETDLQQLNDVSAVEEISAPAADAPAPAAPAAPAADAPAPAAAAPTADPVAA